MLPTTTKDRARSAERSLCICITTAAAAAVAARAGAICESSSRRRSLREVGRPVHNSAAQGSSEGEEGEEDESITRRRRNRTRSDSSVRHEVPYAVCTAGMSPPPPPPPRSTSRTPFDTWKGSLPMQRSIRRQAARSQRRGGKTTLQCGNESL